MTERGRLSSGGGAWYNKARPTEMVSETHTREESS